MKRKVYDPMLQDSGEWLAQEKKNAAKGQYPAGIEGHGKGDESPRGKKTLAEGGRDPVKEGVTTYNFAGSKKKNRWWGEITTGKTPNFRKEVST